ncbi:MAG: deoxynucleoside kinase, partial [Bacteroidota bacterium]
NGLYEDWIDRYEAPRLIINTDDLDFVNEDADRFEIISRIESRLFGLFPEGE